MSRGGAERHRIWSRFQALSHQHRAHHGLDLTNHEIMTWAKVGCSTEPPRPPSKIFLMFIYFWERDRERVWAGEGQRKRGKHRIQNRTQALSCKHRAQCGGQTHEPWDCKLSWSWMLNRLRHPGTPFFSYSWIQKEKKFIFLLIFIKNIFL